MSGWPDRRAAETSAAATFEPPRTCQACGSEKITARARPVTPSTYFHCATCGHIWNPTRRVSQYRRR